MVLFEFYGVNMKYKNIVKGIFVSRPNRFIARVMIDGTEETVHVKNTGRCRELLVPGTSVYLAVSDNPSRKTKYDLISVEKTRENGESILINMDSQIPNDVAEEWLRRGELFGHAAIIRREVKFGNSRFDFYIECGERKIFLEVKGVTLERDGIAMFPDAPTDRGVKHIKELVFSVDEGYEAYILFVVQMKEVYAFRPNDEMHREFGDALRHARDSGVNVLAYCCNVEKDSIIVDSDIEIQL